MGKFVVILQKEIVSNSGLGPVHNACEHCVLTEPTMATIKEWCSASFP